MITREQLGSISRIDTLLNCKFKQLEQLRKANYSIQDFCSYSLDDEIAALEKLIESEMDKLVKLKREAIKLLSPLNERDKTLMELRYFEGRPWARIAETMNYSLQHVYDIHKQVIERIFPEQKNEDEPLDLTLCKS